MSSDSVGNWPPSHSPRSIFIDRSIGKRTAFALAILGLEPLWIGEVYEQDGRFTDDLIWIHEAAEHGYPILTKDRRIWVNPDEIQAVKDSGARVFVIGDGQISAVKMAALFGRHFLPVRRRMRVDGGCLWILRPDRQIERQHETRRSKPRR